MNRKRTRKIVLVLVGLLFLAGVYPVTDSLWHANPSMYTDDIIFSFYVALVIFLLIAVRNPSAPSTSQGRVREAAIAVRI
jgi:hypothetical protein